MQACTMKTGLYQKINGTSGKNHFHEMNGDVGMQGGSKVQKIARTRTTPAISKEVIHPSLHLCIIIVNGHHPSLYSYKVLAYCVIFTKATLSERR